MQIWMPDSHARKITHACELLNRVLDVASPLVGSLVHECPTFKCINIMTPDVQAMGIINTTIPTFAWERELS